MRLRVGDVVELEIVDVYELGLVRAYRVMTRGGQEACVGEWVESAEITKTAPLSIGDRVKLDAHTVGEVVWRSEDCAAYDLAVTFPFGPSSFKLGLGASVVEGLERIEYEQED